MVLASALAFGIALNHPFEQGNKRTGFACAIDFLETNGIEIPTEKDDTLGRVFESVIAHVAQEEAFVALLRQMIESDRN